MNDSERLNQLVDVLIQKFGKDSRMYSQTLDLYKHNLKTGGPGYGIPKQYSEYWKPYTSDGILHHVTLRKNLTTILEHGLEPRDPFPRPWAGMKAIYMGQPDDPLYKKAEQSVLEYVRSKGEDPVLLSIRTKNRLYRSTEPGRTFQIISTDPIAPADIIAYDDVE